MPEDNTEQFDARKFLDELIEEMGLRNEDPKELATLKEQMAQALHSALFQTAVDNIEPEVIDMIMDDLEDEKDPWFIITQLIRTSPAAQIAMIQTIDDFKQNTLQTYNELK